MKGTKMRNREEAVQAALATQTNQVGMCQAQVGLWFQSTPVGDFDGNGRANAVDGWESEPKSAKHFDRNPPAGVPVSYTGGSHGDGHRAISLGNGKIRSTDAAGPGHVATVDLDWPEKTWGLKYVGWSETMNGVEIPLPPPPPPPAPPTRGHRVDDAIQKLRRAEKHAKDPMKKSLIERALNLLLKIKPKHPAS